MRKRYLQNTHDVESTKQICIRRSLEDVFDVRFVTLLLPAAQRYDDVLCSEVYCLTASNYVGISGPESDR